MVKSGTDQKNFDCETLTPESKQVQWVKSHKGLSGVEKRKRYLLSRERKSQCSKGYQNSFRHESNDHAKPHRKPYHPLSH